MEKPPLGVMPKKIWDMKRLEELQAAIARYADNWKEVPTEWVAEYNLILREYNLSHIR